MTAPSTRKLRSRDDDEAAEGEDGQGNPSKRRRAEEPANEDGPVEFGEADIAYQLQAMGDEYDLDDQHDAAETDGWGDAGDEDARALFKDLLNDFNINPFSPWEALIEEGKVIDDARYTVLSTMKLRKEVWAEWTRERIRQAKEQKARQEKQDPRIAYMAFLQERATPKLYWPEFKRKFKKEAPMKDSALADKDREKWYREYINRLKLPQSTLKADLTALLRSLPPTKLNSKTLASHLPPQILADMRYISVDARVRDPLVEAYIQSLARLPRTRRRPKRMRRHGRRRRSGGGGSGP